MEALGNDFVVVADPVDDPALVRWVCDRRRGVGADGILAVGMPPSMDYWNADGTRAEMCGNGLRCVARYLVGRGWAHPGEWMIIETAVGPRRALVEEELVTVEVGRVEVGEEVEIEGRRFRRGSVGNPHAITLVDDPAGVEVAVVGPRVSADPAFPAGANVSFVAVGDDRISMRVWERGVGETLACGSAMVAAAAVTGRGAPLTVEVPGGRGEVFWEDGSAYLRGPAVVVYEGVLELP